MTIARTIVEASTPGRMRVALAERKQVDGFRADADALLLRSPLVDVLRRALLVTNIHERRASLDGLRALLADAAAPLVREAGDRDLIWVIGNRGPAPFLPPSLAAAAAATGLRAAAIAPAYERARVQGGRLGLRGARWLLDDPELLLTIAAGLFDAGERVTLLLPGVSFAGEVAAAKRLLDGAVRSADRPVTLRVGAGVECVRGVLELRAIDEHAAFTEIDLRALTETAFGVARDDARGLFREDPFDALDPVLASLVLGAAARGGERVLRGAPALSSRGRSLVASLGASVVVEPGSPLLAADGGSRAPVVADAIAPLDIAAAPALREIPASGATVPADAHVARVVAEGSSGAITRAEALRRVTPELFDALRVRTLETRGSKPIATGLGVSAGCGAGRVALTVESAERFRRAGDPYVLVVREVYGDEARLVRSAAALVSGRGGRTSHAAIVAAEAGVPCVMHEQLRLEPDAAHFDTHALREGDDLSVDGVTGEIHAGRLDARESGAASAVASLLQWSDEARRLRVLVNADTPEGIRAGLEAGADGVGLVRIENLFFEAERLAILRRILVSRADLAAYARLEELLRIDFAARLAAANGRPITFRLLDASFEEFLPRDRRATAAFADALGVPLATAVGLVDAARPPDPGLSIRASRLSRVVPELEAVQVRALAGAWTEQRSRSVSAIAPSRSTARSAEGGSAAPKLLVPMISGAEEMSVALTRIRAVTPDLAVGAMVELPRAALDAAALARHADFFAWGSNDLTQYACGLGRALFPRVIPRLQDLRAVADDPSATLDLAGVARLVAHAERAGKSARPSLVTGVCGGLATDPRSIAVFAQLGLDYVSVPPSLVARTRLAAARAA